MKNLSEQHTFGGRFPLKVLELARRCRIKLLLKPHPREQIFYDKLFERVQGPNKFSLTNVLVCVPGMPQQARKDGKLDSCTKEVKNVIQNKRLVFQVKAS